MGLGDVKLVAAAGLLLGWQKLLLAILLASVLGSIVLVAVNRLKNQERDTEYPFGPFLVGGILLALLAGEPIITWYLGVLLG
jgi:leader peptidase (prepilin peptidase)/N-methyltransferase